MFDNTLLIVFTFAFVYILAVFRKQLVFEIQSFSLLLFNSAKPGIVLYAIFMLPGTIIHELSHWLVAEILRVPTGEIQILPDYKILTEQEKRLGSVATAKTDPVRGFLIGMAPLITGTTLLIVLSLLLESVWHGGRQTLQIISLVYGLIVLGNSMLISKSDRRYWPFMAGLIILGEFTWVKSGFSLSQSVKDFFSRSFQSVNNALLLTIFLELLFLSLLFSFRKILEKLRHRKIIKD